MPKSLRLSQADFALLRKQKNRRIHGALFSLTLYSLPSSIKGPRAAAVIGKKMITKAVLRNRTERVFREIVRKNKKSLNPHCAYVVSVKKDILGASYEEIEHDLCKLFERTSPGGTIHST